MQKILIALGVIALTSAAALASSTEGVVKEYIKHTKIIKLEDGNSYAVPFEVAVPSELVPGSKVLITLDERDSRKVTGVSVSPR